jgi:hypothetical protein
MGTSGPHLSVQNSSGRPGNHTALLLDRPGPNNGRCGLFSLIDHKHPGAYDCFSSAAGPMKLFRKRTTQDEKVLAEARELAAQRLEQYLAARQDPPPKSLKQSISVITRLRWW